MMEVAMDTDESGEVHLEPKGTAVDTQESCAYLKMQYVIHTLGLYARL